MQRPNLRLRTAMSPSSRPSFSRCLTVSALSPPVGSHALPDPCRAFAPIASPGWKTVRHMAPPKRSTSSASRMKRPKRRHSSSAVPLRSVPIEVFMRSLGLRTAATAGKRASRARVPQLFQERFAPQAAVSSLKSIVLGDPKYILQKERVAANAQSVRPSVARVCRIPMSTRTRMHIDVQLFPTKTMAVPERTGQPRVRFSNVVLREMVRLDSDENTPPKRVLPAIYL